MRYLIAAIIICAATPPPVYAHDYWGNGQEVDKITKRLCCGQNDCHRIDPARVSYTSRGIELNLQGAWPVQRNRDTGATYDSLGPPITTQFLPADHEQPSPDGDYWVCYYQSQVQCFFGPVKGA